MPRGGLTPAEPDSTAGSAALTTSSQPATAGENWIDSADTDWYTNDSSATIFTISTAEELAGLANLVNNGTQDFKDKTIKLGADIDLQGKEWTPIGKTGYGSDFKPFRGVFNGGNHTISNLIITDNSYNNVVGLFGALFTTGVAVSNLT